MNSFNKELLTKGVQHFSKGGKQTPLVGGRLSCFLFAHLSHLLKTRYTNGRPTASRTEKAEFSAALGGWDPPLTFTYPGFGCGPPLRKWATPSGILHYKKVDHFSKGGNKTPLVGVEDWTIQVSRVQRLI